MNNNEFIIAASTETLMVCWLSQELSVTKRFNSDYTINMQTFSTNTKRRYLKTILK